MLLQIYCPGLAGSSLVAPVDADAAGVVEEHVHIVGRLGIVVEVVVDGIVDEIAHHGVAVVVAQQVSLGIADGLVDQVLVPGVVGVPCNEVCYRLDPAGSAVPMVRRCPDDAHRAIRV